MRHNGGEFAPGGIILRRTLTSLAAVLLAVSAAPLSGIVTAHAANISATCGADLTTKLAAANPNDVITLTGGILCSGAYTLKTGTPITLQGATSADGFDGGGTNKILSGVGNGATIIRNLVFQNGKSTTGGGAAIGLTGNVSPTVTGNIFYGNVVVGAFGGAVGISTNTIGDTATVTHNTFGAPGKGNSSDAEGGGLEALTQGRIVVTDNVFSSNSGNFFGGGAFASAQAPGATLDFSRNQLMDNTLAGLGSGGGAFLQAEAEITMTGNVFRHNSIAAGSAAGPAHLGGGVDLRQLVQGVTLTQSHNLFASNSVATLTNSNQGGSFDFGGGGEFAQLDTINSVDDTFNNNTVGDPGSGTAAVGGAFAIQGQGGSSSKTTLHASNLVATNNSVGRDGEGGGIYGGFGNGCVTAPCTAEIDLFDSTVDGNAVGPAGIGAGIAGDQADTANIVNSIVVDNAGTVKQVDGFGTLAVNHSDSCQAAATAYAGTGNVCTDPLLANVPGNDVHQTVPSPTIDAGDTAQVPSGLTSDYEGDARVQGAGVDIGADEFTPAVVTPTLPNAGVLSASAPAPAAIVVLLILASAFAAGPGLRRRWGRHRS
jgi:hypothetical protein